MKEEFHPVKATGHTFRLTLAYDGTDFFGWQVQPGLRTIQGVLANTIREVTGETILPQGSGRTDTGVHASGQVVSMTLSVNIPEDRLQRAVNRRLPSSIRLVACTAVSPEFHARTNVLNKTYEYRIFQRRIGGEERICLPQVARYTWDCRWPITLESLQQASAALIGTHDFTSFAASDPDRSSRLQDAGKPIDNTRTIFTSEWSEEDGLLSYRVTGTGFLHHMVRNIVGTCVDIAAGRLPADTIPGILAARNRSKAGATAPPQGLHLMRVVYCGDEA